MSRFYGKIKPQLQGGLHSMNVMTILFPILGFLIGSIPSGVWYSQLVENEDVRTKGSLSSGATNINRNYGLKAAVIVTAGDVLKGWIPMGFVTYYYYNQPWLVMLTAFAIVLGHAYPIWASFRGGKIVATTIGLLLGFHLPYGIITAILLFTLIYLTHYVSLSSMISIGLTILLIVFGQYDIIYKIGFILIECFLIYRHHDNIRRLIAGIESRTKWGI